MVEYTVTEEESAPSSGEVGNFDSSCVLVLLALLFARHTFFRCHALIPFSWDSSYLAMLQIKIDNLQRYKIIGKTIDMVSLISLQVCLVAVVYYVEFLSVYFV